MGCRYGRFPRLFQDAGSIPGLTWPTLTFEGEMSIYSAAGGAPDAARRRAYFRPYRGVRPDAQVMFSGDLIEYSFGLLLRRRPLCANGRHPGRNSRLQPAAIAPGRGDAFKGVRHRARPIAMTHDRHHALWHRNHGHRGRDLGR